MDNLIKKYKGRIIDCGTNYLIIINQSNSFSLTKEINVITFFSDDINVKDHLKEMYEETFNGDYLKFVKWVLNEYTFGDDIEGFGNPESDSDEYDNAESSDENDTNKEYLYEELVQKANTDRNIKIYSYGKKHRRKPPPDCRCKFNACILSGKRKGLNLKKMNGLDLDVQKSVETSNNFDTFMRMIITKIENDNLNCIAIYCSAGRHRSVTCCEILKKRIYPKSTIYHMELHKYT